MKNIFRILMAVAVLFTASCAKEDISSSIVGGGEANVTFTVDLPELGTRANNYGGGSKVNILHYNVYEYGTENRLDLLSGSKEAEVTGQSLYTITIPMLKGMKYDIVFWAENKECDYYTLTGKEITVNYDNAIANDETRDAFFGSVKKFDPTNPGNMTSVELRRPFAQLNAITTDCQLIKKSGITEMCQSSLKVTSKLHDQFNIFSGKATGGVENVEFAIKDIPAETKTIDDNTDMHLAMNYLLVNGEKALVDVELSFVGKRGSAEFRFPVAQYSGIPVKRNYRTNIIGKLLTATTEFDVKILPGFATAENTIFTAFKEGGEVTLTEDITIAEPLVVAAGVKAVLNLNGHKITTTEKESGRHHYAIDNYGSLTIVGNGAINARGIQNFGEMVIDGDLTITNVDTNGGSAIWNVGKLTINKGTFTTNDAAGEGSYGSALNTRPGGEAVVNGGNFYAYSQLTYAILNEGTTTINNAVVKGKHGAVCGAGSTATNIYGGSFELLENPNVSDHCAYYVSAIYGGTFSLGNNTDGGAKVFYESNIAAGYTAIENGDGTWTVHKRTIVNDANEFAAALAEGGIVELNSDITLDEELEIPAGVTLNGNGKQINGTLVARGDVTFEGHTKVTLFYAAYNNCTTTIGEGACLEMTGTDRTTLGGTVFNITGTITDAKTADKTSIQPSLIIPGGFSITGGSDAELNIKNAYVKIGSTTSKNSVANGTFTINIENSIAEFTDQLTFAEPTNGMNPTFNINVKNSVLTTGTKLILAAPNCNMVVDNSTIELATYFRNSGNVELKNGSILTGSTIQFGENGGHDGKTVVDNSTFTITATSTGNPYDGRGTGSITAKNGATVTVDYYKDMTITTDATSTFNTKVQ